MPTLPDLVLAALGGSGSRGAEGGGRLLLACSGGLDSQVLLHAAAAAWPRARLAVGHVHHGLQPEADDWLEFCRRQALEAGIAFLARRLPPLPTRPPGGVEAWAREERYRALAAMAAEAGAACVLTAHHGDDQRETHHLQRLRGAGIHGLAAMRAWRPLAADGDGPGHLLLLRPFLQVPRRRLADYAAEHRLSWVEDPSNRDPRFARNRVRRQLALAAGDDPQAAERELARIGELQALADAARRQAREDLEACRLHLAAGCAHPGVVASGATPTASVTLSRAALARLSPERAAETLRLWVAGLGCRMPSRARLAEMLRQLVDARSPQARLRHDGRWLLRYRDRIDAAPGLPREIRPVAFRWRGEGMMDVAGQRFLFRPARAGEAGVAADALAAAELLLDQGRGSDRIRLAARGRHRTWKNLCQEAGIAPWARPALPVIRQAGTVMFAAPFGMAADALETADDARAENTPAMAIQWLPDPATARWL